MIFQHKFVEFIPKEIEEGILYISMEYCTASHKCPCGCGSRIVTPLTPINWTLTFDGDTVSLEPSIGNWSYPCQSHYWIKRNQVEWAPTWSKERIQRSWKFKRSREEGFFKGNKDDSEP